MGGREQVYYSINSKTQIAGRCEVQIEKEVTLTVGRKLVNN